MKKSSLALLFFSILFSFALAEAGARLVFPEAPSAPRPKVLVHEASPNLKLLYHPSPGASNDAYKVPNTINSLGFRDREFPFEKTPGVKRIIFLGDSVVYGYGVLVEDSIPKQLEKVFREKGEKVEVLNLGVSGYEAEQEVEFFKELGRKFHPDLVLAGYTLNDSIYASMELDFFHDQSHLSVTVERPELSRRFFLWLFKYSRFLRLLDQQFHVQKAFKFLRGYYDQDIWFYLEDRNRKYKDPLDSPYQRVKTAIVEEAHRQGTSPEALKLMLGFTGIDNSEFYSSHWNVSHRAFQELAELSSRESFSVTAVIFPYMTDPEHYALGPMHDFLSAQFRKLGFGVIDPSKKIFEAYQTQGRSLINDPVHFSPLGTRLIAETLYEELKASQKI